MSFGCIKNIANEPIPLYTPSLHQKQISIIINDLTHSNYSLLDTLFDNESIESLCALFETEFKKNLFHLAKIAGFEEKILDEKIRSDLIHWLTDADFLPLGLKSYADFFSDFTLALNRELFLGIHHHDLQFSFYPVGSFYSTHLDQSRRKTDRKITFIHYLNRHWQAGDGGELRLYLNDDKSLFVDIEPVWGRSLFFVSNCFYHEVRPQLAKSRQSLSGWFSVA